MPPANKAHLTNRRLGTEEILTRLQQDKKQADKKSPRQAQRNKGSQFETFFTERAEPRLPGNTEPTGQNPDDFKPRGATDAT